MENAIKIESHDRNQKMVAYFPEGSSSALIKVYDRGYVVKEFWVDKADLQHFGSELTTYLQPQGV